MLPSEPHDGRRRLPAAAAPANAVKRAFMRLPARERLAVMIHQIEGLEPHELGMALGIPKEEARRVLATGYARMRRICRADGASDRRRRA